MKKVFFLLMASAVFTIWACKKDNATTGPTLELRLTDGPASYQAVNIDIIGAEVHVNKDTGSASGWQPLSIRTGVFNILALNNGLDTLLGSTVLPVGDISQIRLKLGTNNTVKVAALQALIAERGEGERIWGSMIKQALKRRNPGFNESYYGYKAFSDLLEDAEKKKLVALERDEKSGGYLIRPAGRV